MRSNGDVEKIQKHNIKWIKVRRIIAKENIKGSRRCERTNIEFDEVRQ